MDNPRIGVGVPNFGPYASPDGIVAVAKTAEHLGFHTVWTFERLLLPAPPDGENPYGLPEHTASVYDPLETLTWVAAQTKQIRLGTSVLDSLFHPPVCSPDDWPHLTDSPPVGLSPASGRAGCPRSLPPPGCRSPAEAPASRNTSPPCERAGRRTPSNTTAATIGYPARRSARCSVHGHLPVLIGGTSQPAVKRAARLGDGFAAVFQDWDTTRAQIDWCRSAGGDGPVVLRVNHPERVDAEDPAARSRGLCHR